VAGNHPWRQRAAPPEPDDLYPHHRLDMGLMLLKLCIMYMKTNKVSQNRRSKTEMGACAQHRSDFVHSTTSTIQQRAGSRNSALHRRWSGNRTNPCAKAEEGRKVARGKPSTRKDVKNEDRTDYVYENKESDDSLSDRKEAIFT